MSNHQGTQVVLIADDDEDDLFLIRNAFHVSGIPVEFRSVSDGEELMEYLFCRNKYKDSFLSPLPSLILLDLNMPRKDGREALAEIKAHPLLRQIPVVVLTTSNEKADVQQCYLMGASSYVTKPNSFSTLVDTIRIMLRYWIETVELPSPHHLSGSKDGICAERRCKC